MRAQQSIYRKGERITHCVYTHKKERGEEEGTEIGILREEEKKRGNIGELERRERKEKR